MPVATKQEASLSPLFVILSGLGLGVSFLPLPSFWWAWISLVPLLLLWDRVVRVPRFLAEVYTAFLIAYALAFFWPLLRVFSEAAPVAFGGLLVMPLLWTLPFAASLPCRRRHGRPAGLIVLVTFFLAVEMVLSSATGAFPWPVLGNTQSDATLLIQLAEFTGSMGLSLWVLLVNVLFFILLRVQRHRRAAPAIVLVAVIGLSFGFGHWRRSQVTHTSQYVTVGLVQPALAQAAWTERFGAGRLVHLSSLSDSLIAAMNAPPVFMVWPELALPAAPNALRDDVVRAQLQAWTERRQTALLTGALLPQGTPGETRHFANGVVLFRPHDRPERYDQVHRTPFRRRVPLDEQAPWLRPDHDARFVPGPRQHTLSFDNIRIGVLLDFELLLDDFARRYPGQQADFLVALTRDAWWPRAPRFMQRITHARLRAVETRRSVVQVAASGIAALIAPDGSVVFHSTADAPTARLAAVPLYEGTTLFARTGNWLGWSALLLAPFLAAWMLLTGLWRAIKALSGRNAFPRENVQVP